MKREDIVGPMIDWIHPPLPDRVMLVTLNDISRSDHTEGPRHCNPTPTHPTRLGLGNIPYSTTVYDTVGNEVAQRKYLLRGNALPH